MSRTERLLALLQLLRSHRYPVQGMCLATKLGVSLRTVYRDIATLQQQGACIEGESGIGYVLKPDFTLPPLMFNEQELEALVLGMRWVSQRTDQELSAAAKQILHKIASVIPAQLRYDLEANTLLIGSGVCPEQPLEVLAEIRQAIRQQLKLVLAYQDQQGKVSSRTVWPFALGYFDQTRMLACWCELRQSFRHFRTDRMISVRVMQEQYSRPKQVLLKAWREMEGIDPPEF